MLPSPPAEMDYRALAKRKRSDIDIEEARDRAFHLENLSNSIPFTFEPLTKLLRAHLPLSWLSPTPTTDTLLPGSVLHGRITYVTAWDYSILVVRHLPNEGLFVLEKVDDDTFVTHPLQPFVTEKWVQDASIGAVPPVNMQMMLHYLPHCDAPKPTDSRRTPSLGSEASFKLPKTKRGIAARLSILSQPPKQETASPSPLPQNIPADGSGEAHLENGSHSLDDQAGEEKISPDAGSIAEARPPLAAEQPQPDMLTSQYLRQRYLENLYLSKTSLAYYAKGPLSRARARARAADASMTLVDLASFYRESILPAKKMDLKYKESVAATIRELAHQDPVLEEGNPEKKLHKRTKLGRDGLWPVEQDYIARWWSAKPLKAVTADHQQTEIRDATAVLRMREAELQIILILEVLAIESKLEQHQVQPDVLKIECVENEDQTVQKKTKPVKHRNLEKDLEVLADKLCIWHTIGLEGFLYAESDTKFTPADTEQAHAKDQLREFCTDILLPFYGSKLPDLCKYLCKTLAGPEVYDQAQKAARSKEGAGQPIMPGAAIKRRPPSRAGTLDRVLGEDDSRQGTTPTLTRAMTLPPVPHFKREPSEASQRPPSRQASLSFTNRQVDLVADAQAAASKRRKLHLVAAQKQELASAIQALKKPNRQVAGRAFMDEVETRKIELKKPVLITATPRVNRRKTMNDVTSGDVMYPPKTEEPTIPSSTVKSSRIGQGRVTSMSSDKKSAVLAAIHDTPSRSMSKRGDPLPLNNKPKPTMVPEATKLLSHDQVFATPVKSRSVATYFSTPTKQTKPSSEGKENKFQLTDMAFRTMDRAMKMPVAESIYDKLGWNEHDDI